MPIIYLSGLRDNLIYNADIFLYKRLFTISNNHKCLSQLFLFHLNTYVMGLQPLEIFYSFWFQRGDGLKTSESDVCICQILTSKVFPALKLGLNQ